MPHEERAERLVRRIESFSDLVIGFSLALLALTLGFPPKIGDLVAHPWWLIAYAWTFAVIALLWFSHQRLFSHYFTPNTATVIVNFVALALIGLIVYFVQVFVHYSGETSKAWAALAYFGALGLTLLALGVLYAHGVRHRWEHLDSELRFTGVRFAVRCLLSGACMAIGVFVSAMRAVQSMADVWPVAVLAIASVVAARIVAVIIKPRIMGTVNA